MKIRSAFNRFRLLNSVLLLVLMLLALKITPVVRANGCELMCWGWTKTSGCTNCNNCCVEPNGSYTCTKVLNNNDCGTGGPSKDEEL